MNTLDLNLQMTLDEARIMRDGLKTAADIEQYSGSFARAKTLDMLQHMVDYQITKATSDAPQPA